MKRDPESKKIIDGKKISSEIISDLKAQVEIFSAGFRPPSLKVVILGEDSASRIYVRSKVKASAKCGIESELIEMPKETKENELLNFVEDLNDDSSVDGILVQLPLPSQIDSGKVIEKISPAKDVDGFHPYNLGKILEGNPLLVPCTPLGIMELLARYGVKTEGKNIAVVGRSVIVGKPVAMLLAAKSEGGNATVTMCHSRTSDLAGNLRRSDIIISAVGKPEFITADMVKEDVVMVDVGMNRVEDSSRKKGYRLTGDIDFDSVYDKVSLITPVPGGVGPMTVAMLMMNTLKAARIAAGG